MKIKLKLRLGYGAMFIFIIAMALIGLVNLSNLNDRFSELTKQSYPKVEISNSLLRKLDKVANLAIESQKKDVSVQFKINKLNEEIASGIEKLKSYSSNNSGETELISKIANSKISFESLLNNYFNLLNSGSPESTNYYNENIAPVFKNYELQIDELIEKEQALLASSTIESESKYNATKTWIIGLFILIFLVSGGISFWLSKNITNPIKKASDLANALAEGDFKFDVTDVSNDETGELINSMRKMKSVIANLISELDRVGDAASSGKLSVRADVVVFKGDYAKLAKSYNSSLDAVITPLNLTASYIDCLSKGEVPSKISEDYKGDFNEIKVNINQMIDTFNLFIDEIKLFSRNHKTGEIDFYMNEAKFSGVYKQMAQVSNEAVKLHVDNILGILGILKSYSEGDFSSNLQTLPGKQIIANEIMDTLKANITDVIKAINANSAEQEAGDIESYINTDSFNGVYKEMCDGYNACVRQIHGSIGKILMMTDRYASGDYSEKLEQLPGKQIIGNITLDKLRNNILGLINSINETSAKQAAGDTDAFIDTTLFAGAYKEVCEGYNECINSIHNSIIKILNVTKQYSAGNFNPVLEQLLDKQAVANTTLDNLRLNFLNVESEIVKLIRAADEGNLSVRADSSKFTGSYKGLVNGLNEMLDKIISPLNISAEYIDLISKGQIPEKITDEYKGDFNEIKININNLIETLHNVLGETETLIKAAADGQLHVRGDASKFTGVWKTVIDDVNEMIINTDGPIKDLSVILEKIADNDYTTRLQVKRRGVWNDLTVSANKVIRRLVLVQNIMEEVSKGDLGKLEELRKMPSRGPNDKLRPAVLSMMESVRKLLDDSNMLANSFLEGDLNYRPDVSQHKGEFAGVMGGVNQTVDTLASNLHFVLNFLKQVSGGEELQVIDESEFLGEYKQIPVSINKLRNFLYDMIADTTGSAQAALNGDLSARINLEKYPGGWNVIVKGFNDSLDVLINQFNLALEFLKRVSNGDDLELVDETGFNGEYKEMISYINKLRTFLYRLIDDTGATAKAAVQGDLTARIDLSYYPGGWGVITGGFNNTLEALIEPIEEAIHTLEILATGDLTAKMNGEYNGDFSRIQDATNKLSYTLALLIRQIYEGVDSTANSTLEISQATDRMAVATQEQSSQTEEIAGAVEEMSRTINENASHAVKTSEIARKSGVVANEGKVVVENTISKMRDIAEVVKLSAEKIEKLGDSSKQIGEIISVIDDIADQTNLLALNAAIEAARAGEQGRGFAVVADEVRKLAERTTDATKQIAKMINSVQTETDIAVKVMKNGNTEVSAGIALADKAGDALNSILRSANEVIDMITQIASANEQQAATSEQLAQNVSMINTVTSESAIKIQEIANATEGLTALTTQLRNAVEEFKIDEISTNTKLLNGTPIRKNLASRN